MSFMINLNNQQKKKEVLIMANKTAPINVLVEPETKKKLQEKAQALNLSITQYIEKISLEQVIFLDPNAKALLKSLQLK